MSSTDINNCNFYTNNICKRRIRKISNEIDIPESNKDIVNINMLLCQSHYNQLILNKISKIKRCQHPKHDIYETNSTNLFKIPKRFIEILELNENAMICNICRKKTDNDPEYLQNEKYQAPKTRKNNLNNDNFQDVLIDNTETNTCQHLKYDIYLNEIKSKKVKINTRKNLIKVPKRLIKLLGLNELAMICSICRKRTDKDPEYL